jgi:DNA-binding MurR/RpiR family transcriptional regulator
MNTTLKDVISSQLDKLSPQLRQAAQYVAEHPEEVATRSLRYLAGVTELTPPTFSRLATALGYANYEALRDESRNEISRQRLVFSDKARILQESDSTGPEQGLFMLRQGAAAIENINLLSEAIDPTKIESVVNQIILARKVLLVGRMSSQPFVDYMGYMASMAFDNWQVLGGRVESVSATLASMNPSDLAFVIAKAPYARRSIDIAEHVKARGATVIGVTDELNSPLCAHCDATFFVSTKSPQFFSSHVATLVLIETIMGMVVARSEKEVSLRIAAVERESHQMGEYFSNTLNK